MKKNGVQVYRSWSEELEKATPFFVWRNILKQLLQIELWKERLKNKTLKQFIKQKSNGFISNADAIENQLGIELDANWKEYLPLLNDIHRVTSLIIEENEFTIGLKGSRRYHHTISLIKHILEKRSKIEKIVILVEEMQWIDEHSLDLLCDIAFEIPQCFVVFTLRILGSQQSEEETTKKILEKRIPNIKNFRLKPLTFSEIQNLMQRVLEIDQLPPQLHKYVECANGNPLFAVEIAIALKNSDIISIRNRKCKVLRAELSLKLPNSLEEIFASKLDKVDSSPQLVLKIASVVGMSFTVELLKEVYPIKQEIDFLEEYLSLLVKLNFIDKLTPNNYRFKNKLTRDIIYSRLLYKKRRDLHLQIASFYETKYEHLGIKIDPKIIEQENESDLLTKINNYSIGLVNSINNSEVKKEKKDRIILKAKHSSINLKSIFQILCRHWFAAIKDEKTISEEVATKIIYYVIQVAQDPRNVLTNTFIEQLKSLIMKANELLVFLNENNPLKKYFITKLNQSKEILKIRDDKKNKLERMLTVESLFEGRSATHTFTYKSIYSKFKEIPICMEKADSKTIWVSFGNKICVKETDSSSTLLTLETDKKITSIACKSKLIWCGSENGKIICYGDVNTDCAFSKLKEYSSHNSKVNYIFSSKNESYVFTGDENGKVIVWYNTGIQYEAINNIEIGEAVRFIDFTVSEKLVWIVSDFNIFVWDLQKEQIILTWKPTNENKIEAICQEEKTFWTAIDDSILIWSIKKLFVKSEITLKERTLIKVLKGHIKRITCLRLFEHGGVTFIFSGSKDNDICVWNAKTFELQKRFVQHNQPISFLIPISENKIWSIDEGNQIYENSLEKIEGNEQRKFVIKKENNSPLRKDKHSMDSIEYEYKKDKN